MRALVILAVAAAAATFDVIDTKASKSGGREPEIRVRRKLRVLITLAVAAAAATFGVIDTKASEISIHALKLEPQPQVDVEFGLLNTKPEPMISSL
jgi:hypothetical protein